MFLGFKSEQNLDIEQNLDKGIQIITNEFWSLFKT